MNSQFIVFVQVFIVVGFVIWILSRRGGTPSPTVLDMTNDNKVDLKNNKLTTKEKIEENLERPLNSSRYYAQSVANFKAKKYDAKYFTDENVVHAKVLNVIFMWNGHSWDAYEVFGLPAGSSIERVREKYHELRSKADSGQQEFLMEALRAIEKKVNSA